MGGHLSPKSRWETFPGYPPGVTLRTPGIHSGVAYLRRLALSIRGCPQNVRADAARRAKARIHARIRLQFTQGRDPEGRRWKLPKDGHRPAMVRTGALERGYVVTVVTVGTGLSLQFANQEHYAWWLQKGTVRMKPRKQVPDDALPDEWAEDLYVSYQEAYDAWYARLKR